jgi:hypothetical protein
MSAEAERSGEGRGEVMSQRGSGEASGPRHGMEDTGPGLLLAVLARENMQQAWKRVPLTQVPRFGRIQFLDAGQNPGRLRDRASGIHVFGWIHHPAFPLRASRPENGSFVAW